jgi:hypothetical protein
MVIETGSFHLTTQMQRWKTSLLDKRFWRPHESAGFI